MEDRETFLQNIARFREEGRKELLKCPVIDQILANELKSPGTDMRFGVNLFCNPPKEVAEHIRAIQDYLRGFEPGQYYYPPSSLHMTLIEFCHSITREKAEFVAGVVKGKMSEMLGDLPNIRLDSPILGFDSRAIALNFLPSDAGLQTARQMIIDRTKKMGITFEPRYLPKSAHIVLMRYVTELGSKPKEWVDRILGAPKMDLEWEIKEAWLVWGANWYRMQSRINQAGPYKLRP